MKACRVFPLIALVVSIAVAAVATPSGASTSTTELVSVDSAGNHADGESGAATTISADGRFIAFWSSATNLVPGDTNGAADIFVRDRVLGTTERVNVASDGSQSTGASFHQAISGDGRYVAFESYSSNLVPGDTNGQRDVFVHDRQTGTTERVSVASDGTQSDGEGPYPPSISADGRFVAFTSRATNLVPGDTNDTSDIFVHDRQTGVTERVSVASDGSQSDNLHSSSTFGSAISANGRFVAFYSEATNLVPGDTNGMDDVFVRDRLAGTTERVSVASDGSQGLSTAGSNDVNPSPSISDDGRWVAFWSPFSDLVPGDTNGVTDIFVHDRQGATTERVSQALDGSLYNAGSFGPAISADGRYVAFHSKGTTNTPLDVFVCDRLTASTTLVSVSLLGVPGNGASAYPDISESGRFIAFTSRASDLVLTDMDSAIDVFVRDRGELPEPTPTPTPTPTTPTPTPLPAVGGMVELAVGQSGPSASSAGDSWGGSSAWYYAALAGGAAAALALAAGGWYARRRRLR
jgi:Tol biopolymer transport system component